MTELIIEKIVPGGAGLARTPHGVALVRGALPGERVAVALEKRKGYYAGRVLEILDAHPQRESRHLPPGADLPLEYAAQLPIKEEIVREAFRRATRQDVDLAPITGSPLSLGYRTAAQYGVTRGRRLAAHETGGSAPVELETDPLLSPPLARAFDELKDHIPPGVGEVLLRGSIHEDKALVGLVAGRASKTRESEAALVGKTIAGVSRIRSRSTLDNGRTIAGAASMLENFGGILTTVTVRSFAQVNPPAAGLLYNEAAEKAGEGARAVDLYAGSGVLAFHLAPKFSELVAVESSIDGVRRGDTDRARLGIDSVRFHAGDARAVAEHLPADLVSINPPRAGMAPEVVQALAEARPPRILYVSCDPPTWARDVAGLLDAGYRLSFARPFDFYPYTHHVEVLSILDMA